MELMVWLFVLYCTADCKGNRKVVVTNDYFNASSYEGCLKEAHSLIEQKGLTGTWEIECKPYKRKIIDRPAQGN